ncbi:hypothetical protein BYT27DRAFT_7183821 [Phlegmacium glaucopus]|nr:hypothetical protein BYT27DRAFT_7183821 [Phlegmacium glaucopus]
MPVSTVTEDIKQTAKPLDTDIIIVFLGHPGSGKSNFVDILTDQPGRRAGVGLQSCTAEVRAVKVSNHPTYGDRLVLVDTPGFVTTGSDKFDLEILEMVTNWLRASYGKSKKLAGVVYMHQITGNTIAGSPHTNLHMFAKLCGDLAMKKVLLVTTMWDKVYSPALRNRREECFQHEKELFECHWKTMVDGGAMTARSTNSPKSAWDIIDTFLKRQEAERAFSETLPDLHSDLQKHQKKLNKALTGKKRSMYIPFFSKKSRRGPYDSD